MSLEKISHHIKSKINNIPESIKKITQVSVLTAGILTGSGCGEIKNKIQNMHAIVEEIPYNQNSPFSLITIHEGNKIGECNMFRFRYQNQIYTGSARHCVQQTPQMSEDIMILPNLKKTEKLIVRNQQQKISNIKIQDQYHAPKVLELSPLNYQEIENETVSMQGIYPDQSGNTSYKISGKPVYFEELGVFILSINNEDFQKIQSHNTNKTRYGLQGTSGSPILDSKGRVVGVHIAGYNWNDKNMPKNIWDSILNNMIDSGNIMFFNPIRDTTGKIKSHSFHTKKIAIKNQTQNKSENQPKLDNKTRQLLLDFYQLDVQGYKKTPEGYLFFGTDTVTGEKKVIKLNFKTTKKKDTFIPKSNPYNSNEDNMFIPSSKIYF